MSYFTMYQIEQFRQKIDWDNWPLPPEKWPLELNDYTACLSFALGIPVAAKDKSTYEPMSLSNYITDFCYGLGLECRKISSVEEAAKNEMVIQCYEKLINGRFHVIRRDLDGRWVHKEGWYERPSEIVFNGYFNCMYPPEAITSIFAVKKRTS